MSPIGEVFGIVEYFRVGRPIEYAARFKSIEAARNAADKVMRALEDRPRCPSQCMIVDLWTGEVVSRVYPPALDPFACDPADPNLPNPFADGPVGS